MEFNNALREGETMTNEALAIANEQSLKKELSFGDLDYSVSETQEPEVVKRADEVTAKILAIDPAQVNEVEGAKAAVESLGADIQTESALASQMLQQPLKNLMQRGDDGGEVAQSLVDLKMQVEELDPAKFDFETNAFMKLLGKIPGVGTPMKRYFTRYQSSGAIIEAIVDSLEQGKDQLKRDNVTLSNDQKRMRELTKRLEKVIALGHALDRKLTIEIETTIPSNDPRHKFLSEEIVFPLRQRIQDMQQQLLVNQQGILTMEVIVRNNKELIRGVQRATDVTVNALRIAVTLAIALTNQQIVLDKIQAINETTENLLTGNAKRLKQQAVDIHKQASSAQLDIEKLGASFRDIREALESISDFRRKALPQMAENIVRMDKMSAEQEDHIKKLENAKQAKAAVQNEFQIEISG
jgi:uncharacterized protein YaaN involved in tellurite resistance